MPLLLFALLLSLVAGPGPALDELIRTYSYDGLGRLIRSTAPFPDPDLSEGELRTERFYYDGIRRIQEVVTTPLLDLQGAMMILEDEPAAEALEAEVEPGSLTAGGEESQLSGGGGGGEETYLEREYVWGPGDRGVDELFLQIDRMGEGWWVLQDAGGDVVAVCDLEGSGGGGGSPRVCAQFTYDAYGSVFSADHLLPHAFIHAGHKGLFFDRLDVGVADSGGAELPRLVPFSRLFGHARNRGLWTWLGRWGQMDPNQAGYAVTAMQAYHGNAISPRPHDFSLEGRYQDGFNLYGYLHSSSWTRWDPLGLDDYDDLVEGLMETSLGVPGPSDLLTGMLSALLEEYAARQDYDASWSEDWYSGDDWHSRLSSNWVYAALGRGLYDAFEMSIPLLDWSWNPLSTFGGAAVGGKARNRAPGRPRNFHLAGSFHSFEYKGKKVWFNHRGYPKFDDFAMKTVDIHQTGDRWKDVAAADKKAGYGKNNPRPKGYTWHHHENGRDMLLIPTELHAKVGHTGGVAIVRGRR